MLKNDDKSYTCMMIKYERGNKNGTVTTTFYQIVNKISPRSLLGHVLFNLLFSVFVDRCRFVVSFWPLYRVSFKLRHLITLLVSSIFSYLLRGFLWAKLSCFNQLALRLQMLYSKLFEIWFVYNCWILWRGITIVIKNRDPDSNNMHPIFRYTVPIAIRSLMLALYNI